MLKIDGLEPVRKRRTDGIGVAVNRYDAPTPRFRAAYRDALHKTRTKHEKRFLFVYPAIHSQAPSL
jgi:hypothetical protein